MSPPPPISRALPIAAVVACMLLGAACAGTRPAATPPPPLPPGTISHSDWEAHPPLGERADGIRRNLAPGDTARFHDLTVVLDTMWSSATESLPDTVRLILTAGPVTSSETQAEGSAFNWEGYHIALLSAHTDTDELGSGRLEIEVGRVEDLPDRISRSTRAGGPEMRLRIPQRIRMITLHHSGSPEPLRPEDDVPEKIRSLQLWGESDRNWWDVPYHFLIGLDGTIYQGRDYRYRGETNTSYDVDGHLLISVLGNYDIQESTPEQIEAITDVMAWAVAAFDVPLTRIYGHSDLAATSCPGKNLRKYLDDGTFTRGISERLPGLTSQQD